MKRYRALASLQRDNAVCRASAEAGYPLESLPVFEGGPGQRAYLFGQAPGIVEGPEAVAWLLTWLRGITTRKAPALPEILERLHPSACGYRPLGNFQSEPGGSWSQ